jgi:hypothetical protein
MVSKYGQKDLSNEEIIDELQQFSYDRNGNSGKNESVEDFINKLHKA